MSLLVAIYIAPSGADYPCAAEYFKIWRWADCVVPAAYFQDLELLAHETMLTYVYYESPALTPFHSADEINVLVQEALATRKYTEQGAAVEFCEVRMVKFV